MPNEYEDLVAVSRSSLSFNSQIMKMSNLTSFNHKNQNEVLLSIYFRPIVLLLMVPFIFSQLIMRRKTFQKYTSAI
jgi:hypothetical protein